MWQWLKPVVAWALFAALLVITLAAYQHPDFVVEIANLFWGCWQ